MKTKTLFCGIFFFVSMSFSQELYGTWSKYREITVNTTSSGANVRTTLYNFPVLVRLYSTNFIFSAAARDGRDVRFAKTNTRPLKYQIESWDSVSQSAAVWVLLDTVFGNSNTANFRIYYGKAGVADSSNGGAVFDTANGFQGVFHLGEPTDGAANDATANRFFGLPRNVGGSNPQDTVGVIGRAKKFLGNNTNRNGGNYHLYISTGANTFDNNALNFQNDSATRNGIIQYTISTWMKVTAFPTGTATRKGVISKSKGTNGQQFHLQLLDPAIDGIQTPVGDTERVSFADGPSAVYKRGDHRLTPWTTFNDAPPPYSKPVPSIWHHVAAVRNGPVGTPGNLHVYVDGAFACSSSTSLTATTRSDYDVTIGSYSNDSGFFSGALDEVRFENVARDTNWTKLSYETQKPTSATIVIVNGGDPPPAPPSGFSYKRSNLILGTGVAMTPDTPTVSGQVSAYAVTSGTLPAGLSINQTTGIISGTPTVLQVAKNYTVTVIGPGGSTSTVITITVNGVSAISPRSYTVHVNGLNRSLSFHIPDGVSSVQLSAEDMMGRVVWRKDFIATKSRVATWNGIGMDGRPVSPGMYMVRMKPLSVEP